jgi:mannitol 2-dehydrogenase
MKDEKDRIMKPVKLSSANLDALPGAIRKPNYSHASLKPGILHFGVGNFHRAHMAVYLDDLFNKGIDHDWALVGAGVMPSDEVTRQKLSAQDYLTTVVEQDNDLSTAHITGPLIDFIPPADKAGMIAKLASKDIRIVSLTITEGGYFIDATTGKFNAAHPAIVKDAGNPGDPSTVFGFIVAGLVKRRAAGVDPFTVMSCDNVPHNGLVTRNSVVGLAKLIDPSLAEWITGNVSFPNGMVDRITPATGDRERRICAETFGVEDVWPVFCEEFKQWVLEDNFTMGRPALEKVGVTFVKDVTPFENMKIRMLNGGHAVIAYIAGLMDIVFVHEAMENKLVAGYLAKVEAEEIMPCVPPVPETDLNDYLKLVQRRFANPKIGDTVRRLCLDGSNRQPKFIVTSISDRLKAGKSVEGLALESALWCRYCYGTTDSGKVIEPNDPNWDHLQSVARSAKGNPSAWLGMREIYSDIGKAPALVLSFTKSLNDIWAQGAEATVKAYLAAK